MAQKDDLGSIPRFRAQNSFFNAINPKGTQDSSCVGSGVQEYKVEQRNTQTNGIRSGR